MNNEINKENLIDLGNYYIDIKDYKNAIKSFEEYIKEKQDFPEVYDTLGVLYSMLDRYKYFDKKITYFKKALELNPNYTETLRHLAIAYRNSGDNFKCTECYEKILQQNPTNDDYFNYAIQKIKLGDFEEGLKYYKYRFSRETNPSFYPDIKKPKWDGNADLSDRTLLVHFEQGLGDSIQFFRYLLKINAKKIIFRVQDALSELFKTNTSHLANIEIIKKSDKINNLDFDYHIPLADLLSIFNTRIDNIPFAKGYLKADSTKTTAYKKEFCGNNKLKIGISWSGAKSGNPYRNIPIEFFYPLAKLENTKVYSLQKEAGEDLQKCKNDGIEITDLGSGFNDFSDTAAALSNVDLVVSCDNVITNLAGAMGKKTFLLLNKDADWRWFLDEHKSPWYDSITIFKKQDENDSWDIVVEKAINEIKKYN